MTNRIDNTLIKYYKRNENRTLLYLGTYSLREIAEHFAKSLIVGGKGPFRIAIHNSKTGSADNEWETEPQ